MWPTTSARSFRSVVFDEAENDVLAFMSLSRAYRKRIASTNPIEWLNAATKRRTDVIGIFPSVAAIPPLVSALLLQQNDEWQLHADTSCSKDSER